MRYLIAILILSGPAAAWDFTPGLPCLLSDQQPEADIELSYDPTQPLYSITLRRATPWQDAPEFALTYQGQRPLRIATNRHVLSDDGLSLTVTDRGFGNVLNGMQFNTRAIATLGDIEVTIDLTDAAGPTEDFRGCDLPLA